MNKMKTNRAKRVSFIVAAALMATGLVFSIVALLLGGFDMSKIDSNSFVQKNYEVGERFNSIRIDDVECDVNFAPLQGTGDGYGTVACYENDNVYYKIEVRDGTLFIERVDERKWYERFFGGGWRQRTLTLYLPESNYNVLSVRTVSGDMSIPGNFTFKSVEAYSTSGDVELRARVNDTLSIKTVSGDIDILGITAYSVYAEVVSGDVELSSIKADGNITAKTASGDIELTDISCEGLYLDTTSGENGLRNVIASGNMCISSVSGNIMLQSCDAASLDLKSTSGNISGILLSGKVFSAQSKSGNVSVPPSRAGGVCEARTVSGSIKFEIDENGRRN